MLAAGTDVRGYRIERLLGHGGMGEVYEATQVALARPVALKVLRPGLGADDGFRERFRREGQRQAGLDHPHVVTVYEAGESDEGLYLAMRLVRGVTLKQLIAGGEIDPARALALLTPIADALDAAHALGLVHRDVKPQNILVREDDHPFLADFGLTRDDEDTSLTRTGQFVGTIDYVAPEVLRGEPVGPAGDVYALAGVLYECLTGSVPFPRPAEAAVLYAHAHEAPPSATALRPALPTAIDAILAAGMAKEPEDRPATAGALLRAARDAFATGATASLDRVVPPRDPVARGLRPVVGDTVQDALPVAGATPATQAIPAPGAPTRRSPLVTGLGLLAALALAGGGYAVGGQGATEPGAPAALSTSASNAALGLSAPAGWTRLAADDAPSVPGLELRSALTLQAPADLAATGVQAGVAEGAGPTLLPGDLRANLVDPDPRATPVRLGTAQALRYRDLRVRGFDRRLTLYAVPVDDASLVLACYAPATATTAVEPTCTRIAGSLTIGAGTVRSLGGDAAAVAALRTVTDTLGRARRTARQALGRARRPASQAAAARDLQAAARRAAAAVAGVGGGAAAAPARDGAGTALRAMAGAYGALAAATRAQDKAAYDRARARVRTSERATTTALRGLAARLAAGVGPL